MNSNSRPNSNTLLLALILAIVAIGVIYLLNMPDRRSGGEKVGDAINQLSEGDLKGAGRALEDRTPGEKLEDGARDLREDIRDSVR